MTNWTKSIAMLCTLLVISAISYAQNIVIEPGKNLVGIVNDGHKGVEGVVVSDGYTVTTTNKDGVYQLERNEKAKFVFISTPSNYEIPVEGRLPVQHKRINQELKTVYANFQISKAKSENNFTLVAISDPQPSHGWEADRFRNETVEDINALIKSYHQNTPTIGIVVGDLVWDAPKLYPTMVDKFNDLHFTILPVIGNHDHDQNVKNDDYKASHNFEKYFGPTYYSYNKGQCHFVVLDDMIYGDRKNYVNEITLEQLEWLKQDLSHVDKNKLIILGVHVPTTYKGKTLNNTKELYDILEGYKVVIISGHTHDGETTFVNENIVEYNLHAAFGSGWVGDIGRSGVPNGYGVFEIKGNKLENYYYKSTNLDKELQMKLYPLNSWKSKADCMIANIWNWDEKWTVEVYENGKKMEGVNKYTDFDPYAYEYMHGPKKPKHRPSTEPKKTHKLFSYKPSSKDAIIKFVAKDEFNNEYSSEINLNK